MYVRRSMTLDCFSITECHKANVYNSLSLYESLKAKSGMPDVGHAAPRGCGVVGGGPLKVGEFSATWPRRVFHLACSTELLTCAGFNNVNHCQWPTGREDVL